MPAADIPRLCLALDVKSAAEALALVDELGGDVVGCYKIGLELFIAAGPQLVRDVRARGVDVFLDLKLHDISATVGRAVARAIDLDVRFLTIHASGGAGMMRAAAAAAAGSPTTLLAVTVLTSLSDDDVRAVGFDGDAAQLVLRMASLANDCGVGGVVCSPLEVAAVKGRCPQLFAMTPGIRGKGDTSDDQVRTMSADDAIAAGADAIVVGRPIRGATDRRGAARAIANAIADGLRHRQQEPS
jgi:orotidine-5'-phosphate decarboxylase